MRKTYKQKLYKSKKNKKLHAQQNLACEIYNFCIEFMRNYYETHGKSISKFELQKILTQFKKKSEYKHWNKLGSHVIQDITDRIYGSYQAFYNAKRKGRKASPPSFRIPEKYKSITLKQSGYKLLGGNKIRIGKDIFKFHNPREIEGEINTVTVKRDALGDMYLFISCTVPDPEPKEVTSGKIVGFDFGLKTFITTSNEKRHISPQAFFKNMDKVRHADRALSSKEKDSNNRLRACLTKARVYKKTKNQREDHFHKLAKKIAEEYAVICVEDLNIAAMKKLWGRKVSDVAYAKFLLILGHHCRKTGAKLVKIGRYEPTSKQCHKCLWIKQDLSLNDRKWTCKNCHAVHDRDVNAAKNILRVGASTLGLGDICSTLLATTV